MKNSFGQQVIVTLFGESHGTAIGAVLDGIAPGIPVDEAYITSQLSLRRPQNGVGTKRVEKDEFQIMSGVYQGKTTGSPLCIVIPNQDVDDSAYQATKNVARPGHADFAAYQKYHGFEDARGGGHFSGRVTAALVAVGAICRSALQQKGIQIATHIQSVGNVFDDELPCNVSAIRSINQKPFATVNDQKGEEMKALIAQTAQAGDSVGGTLYSCVLGMPAGVGEPWFDSVEGVLSHALFSIPAVKGVSFGDGFALAQLQGSQANDEFALQNGKIVTMTNHNGGINGGITNGMPLTFTVAVKPTPSIAKQQNTVNYVSATPQTLSVTGRHDACIVPRARAVVDALTAIVLCDMLSVRFGTDYLMPKQ